MDAVDRAGITASQAWAFETGPATDPRRSLFGLVRRGGSKDILSGPVSTRVGKRVSLEGGNRLLAQPGAAEKMGRPGGHRPANGTGTFAHSCDDQAAGRSGAGRGAVGTYWIGPDAMLRPIRDDHPLTTDAWWSMATPWWPWCMRTHRLTLTLSGP